MKAPSSSEEAVRVRFAPSPTGSFHWGSARTALFNWLFARKENGKFIVRIEDTDAARSQKKYEDEIFQTLRWLGILWDEGPVDPNSLENAACGTSGPYRSSERAGIYSRYLRKLIDSGKAYYCYCTKEELEAERQGMLASGMAPKYGGHCRNLDGPPSGRSPQVIRFKTPELALEVKDLIRGVVSFDASLFGDFAIARGIESPLFHFAVAVDDFEMKISHVIRGEDHISNTPRQILILRALNLPEPQYAHLPLILGNKREKLSKRHLAQSILEFRERGFLPEAIVNFIALLGWHPKDEREVFIPSELIDNFNLRHVQKSGAIFNEEKLFWMNSQHIKMLSIQDLYERLGPFMSPSEKAYDKKKIFKIIAMGQERMKTLAEFREFARIFLELPEYGASVLKWKNQSREEAAEILDSISKELSATDSEELDRPSVIAVLDPLIGEKGRGEVLWPLRAALSGQAASPDPFDILEVLGKEESLRRIDIAINKLT